ncbi:MAG: hypothetical protein ACR2JZ_03755, partial [Candidatus Limnocylindrales bacterium]
MTGAIALVGSGEFTPALESIDRELLAATGRTRPRVAVLLATAGAPHSNDGPERRGELGYQHFRTLGAEVEVLVLRSRDAADDPAPAQAVGEADLVYLVGNRSTEICPLLADSPVLAALRR